MTPATTTQTTDVLIVGAGPTGLMLANWLARFGVQAIVVDGKNGPTRESRALLVQARSLEVYDQLGLPIAEHGYRLDGIAIWQGASQVAQIPFGPIGVGQTPHPYLTILEQSRNETFLNDHLQTLGGAVRWETHLLEFTQDAQGITATVRHAADPPTTIRARYLCGADGAHSSVRHALGVAFPGSSSPGRFYVADTYLQGRLDPTRANFKFAPGTFMVCLPMGGSDHFRLIGIVPPAIAAKETVSFADLQPLLRDTFALQSHDLQWFTTYNVNHRVAAQFRAGRAFLLGDAAHAHSPVGGQGMNTGLLDAHNLAWKLAAVIHGEANPALLATYEAERRPFAQQLVRTTDRAFGVVTANHRLTGLLRGHLLPAVLGKLAPHLAIATGQPSAVARAVFRLIAQLGIRYDHSPLNQGRVGNLRGGERLPFVPFRDTTNFAPLQNARPQLHCYGPPDPALTAWAATNPWLSLHQFPYTRAARAAGLREGAVYLIRPDGYIALPMPRFQPAALTTLMQTGWGWRATG